MLFHAVDEGATADVQVARGLGLVSIELFQGAADEFALDGFQADLNLKWNLINQIFTDAKAIVQQQKQNENKKQFGNLLTYSVATFGLAKFVEYVNE